MKEIKENVFYLGQSDFKSNKFENLFPIYKGMAYNSYLIKDEKTCLFDTVDESVSESFLNDLSTCLNKTKLDYLVVLHMEPDHCANLKRVLDLYPDVTVVGNIKTFQFIQQFFNIEITNKLLVKDLDQLNLGKETITFVTTPMVHWPEVMMAYLSKAKILFSADAFGTFGGLSGNIFADQVNFEAHWLDEARRYYTNIVGKYGLQVIQAIKKVSQFDIESICPLHGPIWRKNLNWFIEKYQTWASYSYESEGYLIIAGSIYGHTKIVADKLGELLDLKGAQDITILDPSNTDISKLVSLSFKYKNIVILSPTYNCGIYPPVERYLNDIKSLGLQNRNIGIIENGTWGPMAGKLILNFINEFKNFKHIEPIVTIKSSLNEASLAQLELLADNLLAK